MRETVSEDAADRVSDLKKQPMADAAEQLLAGTGWLPAILRTEQPAMSVEGQDAAGDARLEDVSEPDTKAAQPYTAEETEAFNVAAE